MALPVQSVRALPEHRQIIQNVADLLKEGHAEDIERWLNDRTAQSVGPFRDEDAAVKFLATQLIAVLDPLEIWLFGSRGRRKRGLETRVHPASDIDLLVILKDGLPEEAYSDYMLVRAPIAHCGVPCDVVPVSRSAFQADKSDPTSICHAAYSEGVCLYKARPSEQVAP
jgi:predicted nucleotidyltransferase